MSENALVKNWWVVLLRGALAILFGVLVFTQTDLTLSSLILAFGTFVFIEGGLTTVSALRVREQDNDWWMLLIEGLSAILMAVLTFMNPLITAMVLLFYIATWAVVMGVLRIISAIRLRHRLEDESWMLIGGGVSVAFGVLTLGYPGPGALALLSYIGGWAFVTGFALVLVSVRLKATGRPSRSATKTPLHASAP
jgi:uncharacterized membrane protein HdeD (DUF308 family)